MAGMVVQHNLNAINANNKMNINVSGVKKATEKLSSGFQINRAGDNAAGLAISEKMRAQTRGLSQAINNANDGISLIQTAEGGLNETHAILQRMRELAVQSANGTYQDFDREAMQLEVQALKSEVDRIAASTEYNGIKLLDGSLSGVGGNTNNYGARFGEVIDLANSGLGWEGTVTSNMAGVIVDFQQAGATKGGENATWDTDTKTITINLADGQTYTQAQLDEIVKNATVTKGETVDEKGIPQIKITLASGVIKSDANLTGATSGTVGGVRAATDDLATAAGNLTSVFLHPSGATEKYADTIQFISNSYGVDSRTIEIVTDAEKGKEGVTVDTSTQAPGEDAVQGKFGAYILHLSTGVEYSAKDIQNILAKAGLDIEVKLGVGDITTVSPDGDVKFYANQMQSAGAGLSMDFAGAGAGVGKDKITSVGEGLTFQIGANGVVDQRVTLNVDDMSSSALGIDNVTVAERDDANDGIAKIDDAINTVSLQRAGLGALQNRLEYTVNNLTVTHENLTAAESQIRDTDMAKEMIEYTKFNILQQASQAMLAQANQAPQAVLQLLG